METLSVVSVQVANWVKFNPRSDRANYSWFRLQNDFFTNPGMHGLSQSQRLIFLYLLCEASRTGKETLEVVVNHLSDCIKEDPTKIINDLQVLALRKNICVFPPSKDTKRRESRGVIPATDVRTDGRTPRRQKTAAVLDADSLIKSLGEIHGDERWVRTEFTKASAWLLTKPGRKMSPKFFTGWLNRSLDTKPLTASPVQRKNTQVYNPETETYEDLADVNADAPQL